MTGPRDGGLLRARPAVEDVYARLIGSPPAEQADELRLWEMEPSTSTRPRPHRRPRSPARVDGSSAWKRSPGGAYPVWITRVVTSSGLAPARPAAPVVALPQPDPRRSRRLPAVALVLPIRLADDQRSRCGRRSSHVRPAHAAWLALLERCAGRVRSGDGVCHLAEGEALYRHQILAWTTLTEDPHAIHAYGLERLAEIEAQARRIAAELGQAEIATLRRELDRSSRTMSARRPAGQPGRGSSACRRPSRAGSATAGKAVGRAVEPHMEQEAPPAFCAAQRGRQRRASNASHHDPASRPLTASHRDVPRGGASLPNRHRAGADGR
jgi:hypothetical protein